MRLSVALCTYNGRLFIREQISSILDQELPVHEVQIFDDGSDDGTRDLLDDLQRSHPDLLRIHHNSVNAGARDNFEQAVRACTGDIIFLCDQDDVWHPDKTRAFVAAFKARPGIWGLFSDGDLIGEQGSPLGRRLWQVQEFAPGMLPKGPYALHDYLAYRQNVVTGSALAVRKAALPYILPFHTRENVWHDEWIGYRLSALGRMQPLDRTTYGYRIHPGQLTGLNEAPVLTGPARWPHGARRSPEQQEALRAMVAAWIRYDKLLFLHRHQAFRGDPGLLLAGALTCREAYLETMPVWLRLLHRVKWRLSGEFGNKP